VKRARKMCPTEVLSMQRPREERQTDGLNQVTTKSIWPSAVKCPWSRRAC
jgi:hypothetical protein